jgi:branched-chain amino acid transport system permease protein
MRLLIQQIINGLSIGSEYALWTVGYGLVYQVLGLMHFAHGNTLLLCGYIAFAFVVTLSMPFWAATLLCIVAGAILAMIVERSVYRPLVARNDNTSAFIAALGAAYILANIATLGWGRLPLVFPAVFPQTFFTVGGITTSTTPFLVLAVTLVVVGAFLTFLRRTKLGQAIVLVGQDRAVSSLMGIPVPRVVTLVYALSGAIGVIGALLFLYTNRSLDSTVGFYITWKAFVAAIVGGIGRIEGAVLGGLILGLLETLIITYVSDVFEDAIVFSILAAILVIRPAGLFGRRELVKL